MDKSSLVNLFLEATHINSSSGYEKEMAEWIMDKMKNVGWKVWMDDSGKKNQSNSGNVYAVLEVNQSYETLLFSAHMDTVQKETDKINAQFDGVKFTSSGDTILGADNKSGIVSLLASAQLIDKSRLHYNILYFFPTREESGVMGSSFFTYKKKIKYAFNVDSSDRPGVFIYRSLGYVNFKIIVHGISAHAAKSYEKGKNAIVIASNLIMKIPLGKHAQSGWTLNIGVIQGGSGTNVVPDRVELLGEIRAFKKETLNKVIDKINNICLAVSSKNKVKIEMILDDKSYIPAFIGKNSGSIINYCKNASKRVGLNSFFLSSYSTSDSNNLSKNLSVISVSRGGENAHSVHENLKYEDLQKTIDLIGSLMTLKVG